MPAEATSPDKRSGLLTLGRALAHRNYRLFFAGQGISLIGTWMTRVATSWLVFRISGQDSAFLLGLVGFCGQVPTFVIGPVAGALVDRWDRHRTLLATQALAMVQSALMALVAFNHAAGTGTLWQIAVLSLFQGLINAFDMPTRQAFLVEMVTRKEDLGNAIALNSTLVNGARLVGPALAGVIIGLAGEAWCFLIDAVSYLAVLAALLAMHVMPRPRTPTTKSVRRDIAEGFRYTFGFAPIRSILLLLALVSFMGMPYSVLLPIFAADLLHGGAYTLGLLTSASGVGALMGAVYLASRRSVLGLGPLIVVASCGFGLGLIGLSLSRVLWLSVLFMLLSGAGMMIQMASSNTILQTIVAEEQRGRVMSFYSMAFLGMTPFGSLFAGCLAGMIGAPNTVLVGGITCVLGGIVFASRLSRLRELVRPIYARIGVLPEVASGTPAAAELTRPPEE